jgi:hypothetical protein
MIKDLQFCLLVLMLGGNSKGQRANKYGIETVHGTVPTYLGIINIPSIPIQPFSCHFAEFLSSLFSYYFDFINSACIEAKGVYR